MGISDDDLSDFVGDSNGPAFQREEVRTGPPLEYVSGKAESALLAMHEVFRSIQRYVPDDLPQPDAAAGTTFSTKEDGLLSPAWDAFRLALVAYLALNNMLHVANEPGLVGRVLDMPREAFRKWLYGVSSEGSPTGA